MNRERFATSPGALVFAIVFPSLVTWVYFLALTDAPSYVQQTAYAVGKTIQFTFPLVWILLISHEKIRCGPPRVNGLWLGIGFGLLVLAAMLFAYFLLLKPAGFFEQSSVEVRRKIQDLGGDTLWKYICLGFFYSVAHSLMEEYYWRWFVFGRLRQLVSFGPAATISSLGFMAHHIILLGVYFQFGSPVTYLFSVAVAVGGIAWAWIYERSGSLYGPWFSHLLVDAGIFLIGFDLARPLFQSP